MREIVILGGGFAGVSAALYLKNKIKEEAGIVLIDKNSYHLFTPSLYEVATSEEPTKNISIPYAEILGTKVRIVKGKVHSIDLDNKLIRFDNEMSYSFDYLILALGSQPAYFDIEGLEKYCLPLKTLENGVEIKNKIKNIYQEKVVAGKNIRVIVGGGGFCGTEFAAELTQYRKRLSLHHNLPKDKFQITVIQGSSCLLKELDQKVSKIAEQRLKKEDIELCFGARIKKVEEGVLETDDLKKHKFDILIWTGGVKANSVLTDSGFKVNGRGQVAVDQNMQVIGHPNIFAAGDVAEFADPLTNKPVPGVAQVSEDEGRVAAENVYRSLKEMDLVAYKYFHAGYIVPIKGRFAVADFKKFRIIGFFGWVLQQLVFLYYLQKILSIKKAFKKWNRFEMYLAENS